jgi:N-acetylmuramoyl-L-alanine amidase
MNILSSNLKFKPLTPLDLRKVEYIIIHHLKAITATPEDIHKWHLDKGWSGAGYNEYIRKDGTVYIMRGDNKGAHTENYNTNGYGIAVEGDYDVEQTMPTAQFNSLVQRIKHNLGRFPNVKKVVGHKDLDSTACPGKNFPMIRLRKAVSDMDKQHIAQKYFDWLKKEKGLTIHETRFDDKITRGELFIMLARALGYKD